MGKIIDWLDKFSGVFGAILIFYAAAKFIYDNHNKVPPKFLTIAAIIALLFFTVFISKIKKTILAFSMKQIENETKSIVSQSKSKKFSPKLILTNNQMEKWLKLVTYQAKQWAYDAEIKDAIGLYEFYYNTISGTHHRISATFYSKSREEILIFAFNGNKPYLIELQDRNSYSTTTSIPFYKNQPKWRKAVLAVYKFIEDRLESDLQFTIRTADLPGKGLIAIDCGYGTKNRGLKKSGKFITFLNFEKNETFIFDGKYIFNNKSKIKVN
ncbi:MAG TPA: hypothetical protein VF185_04115 [Patescibacteria group bacterium]